ncbi:MAG: DUF3426 domain-containing protein [Desulfuromonadaceae bacterium]|nr:DUF3426 domain-containing protein [Desulfuromonadaceae bacterium]
MIIQCEKCQTRFRLDDSRVTGKGVKVRCTKCKHVFTVRKEEPGDDSLQPGVAVAELPVPAAVPQVPAAPAENWSFPAESDTSPAADSPGLDDTSLENDPTGFSSLETFDASKISFDTEEDEIPVTEGDQPSSAKATDAIVGEIDFSEDEMFGAVVESTPEPSPGSISFDFEGDSFAEAMDVSSQDVTSKNGTQLSLDTSADAPLNLGEIDFGDELTSVAVQEVSLEDLKPSQEILFAPIAEAPEKSADDVLAQSFLAEGDASKQVIPPLSIPSRRKQSPVFGVLIAIVALLAISVLGYFGYSSFSTPKDTASSEGGNIAVRSVTSAFVTNSTAGELLVISGEAFNEYTKPRAALQIMVTVFDESGQTIATKSAYGGNPLTVEQLKTLPLDKIEAAMANPFGDSLANMGVASGRSIPFVVVLAQLPAGARDFSVKSAGSTVATGK